MSEELSSGFGGLVSKERELKDKPKDKPKPNKPKLKTTHDLAVKHRRFTKTNKYVPQARDHYDWQHAIADQLHGWSEYNYHYQDTPMVLSDEDYQAALKAAANYPNTGPHEPALSPMKKEQL